MADQISIISRWRHLKKTTYMITYPQIYYICKSIKNTLIYEFSLNLQFRGVITPSPRPLRGGWSATLPNGMFWSNSTTWLSPLNFYTLCKSQFQNTWPFSPTMFRVDQVNVFEQLFFLNLAVSTAIFRYAADLPIILSLLSLLLP